MSNDDQLLALERLAKLRETGVLSEEEFAAQKSALFNQAPSAQVSVFRRLWFVVLLTCLIFTFPVALVILLTGDVYKKVGASRVPISKTARYIYAGLLGLWLAAVLIRAVLFPDAMKKDWREGASDSPAVAAHTPDKSGQAPPATPSADQPSAAAAPNEQPATNDQPAQSEDSPNMRVELAPSERPQMVITGDDDRPFTITRIIFNGRARENGCDYPDFPEQLAPELKEMQQGLGIAPVFPKTLERGQQAAYLPSCGQILEAEIQTDRGVGRFRFGGGN